MKFTHASGSRPLDGYTIKRGVGQGGFGEVYYALSDGGKEVALKLLRGNDEVELRGVAQCLNLKHPHLVALYDIKKDERGDSWIVMEYIAGESLSALLNRHPKGLPVDLIHRVFGELAKAIGHLHQHGIVHRDLKPGNVFIEDGLVKVGDYGLCKFISGSQRSPQTQSVGTVHYMAPEVSTGNYGKQIDIYAAGVILYEMLTGRVPFEGQSAGEILMKHMTSLPDLSVLPVGYAEVVGTALAKSPARRQGTMLEMAADLDRAAGVQSQLEGHQIATALPASPPAAATGDGIDQALPVDESPRQRVYQTCVSLLLAAVAAGVTGILYVAAARPNYVTDFGAFTFMLILSSWTVILAAELWPKPKEDSWHRRFVMLGLGLGLGFASAWLNGWSMTEPSPETHGVPSPLMAELAQRSGMPSHLFALMAYYGILFFLVRSWRWADPHRPHRFGFYPLLATGFVAYFVYMFLAPDGEARSLMQMQSALAPTLAAGVVQVVSPWIAPAPAKRARRFRLRFA
jgi:hypothetical protein